MDPGKKKILVVDDEIGVRDVLYNLLWSSGRNSYGQLGLGDTTDRLVPTQVEQ